MSDLIELQSVSTKTKGDEGVWFDIKHPLTGRRLTYKDGEGRKKYARFKVRSIEADCVRALYREEERKELADKNYKTSKIDFNWNLHMNLLVEIEGIAVNGVPLKDSDEDKKTFLNASPEYRNQIGGHSVVRNHFLG